MAQPGGRELFGASLGVAPQSQPLQGMLLRPSTDICPKDLTRDMRGFFNSLLEHVRFRHARLRTRGEQPGLRDDFGFIQVEAVTVAIRAGCDAACDDRFAALANLVALRRRDDFFCTGRPLGKLAIGHT